MAKMELISWRKEEATHVDGQEIGTMAASNRHRFVQA